MTASRVLSACICVQLAGCAANPYVFPKEAPVYGTTIAQGPLRTDVFRMLPAYAGSPRCREPIERVDVEPVEYPKEYTVNPAGNLSSGTFKERWLVTMCGKKEEVFVTFRAQGSQTMISMGRKP